MNKKFKIFSLIAICSILSVGCMEKDNSDTKGDIKIEEETVKSVYKENEVPYINPEENDYTEIDNELIYNQYKKVKKEDLTYESGNEEFLLFEAKEGLAIDSPSQNRKPINDRRYADILLGYRYASEINPIELTYEGGIEMAKRLLPDDIVEEKSIEVEENKIKYIFYKSEKGNFIVGLNYGFETNEEGAIVSSKNNIVGLHYLKQVK